MSNEKDFDIDALLQVEPPKKDITDVLEIVDDNAKETVSTEDSTKESSKKTDSAKKSLFGFGKKDSKPEPKKENKMNSQASGKKKIMLLVFVAVSVAMGGVMVMQQMKSKNLNSSPFPQMPTQEMPKQNPQPQATSINPALPQGLAKAPELPPTPANNPETVPPVAIQPPVDGSVVASSSENNVDSKPQSELPKLNNEGSVKKEDTTDKVILEQKEALNKILAATEANINKPKEEIKPREESKPKVEIKQVESVVEKPSKPMQSEPMNHSISSGGNVNNSTKQLEIIELSAKYVKVATLSGKVVTYEVGDLLPGNAKILRIDVHKEKIYTNKGNIVIQ